jgi:cell volume regulation protein A
MTPFGYRLREQLFLSWAGLRGAVPIVLATFALSADVSRSDTIFNAVFFVVLVSTIVQGMTLVPFARRLGLTTEERPFYDPPVELEAIRALGGDIVEHDVRVGEGIVGLPVRELGLPPAATVMLIVRDASGIPPNGSTILEAGDRLYIMIRGDARPEMDVVVRRWASVPQAP